MKASLGFMVLSLLVVGCATTKSPVRAGPPSPCAKELMDQGYVSGRASKDSAEAYCTQYSPGEIAIAKDLHDRKYEPRFAEGLSTAHQYTPAQIACAKKERDSGGSGSRFQVPETCVDATFHDSTTTISATRGMSTAPAAATAPAESAPAPSAKAAPASSPAPSSGSLAATAATDAKTNSLYDVLSADKRFSKFLSLVEYVGLTKNLKSGGPWTVMAPTNAAIGRYPGGYDALKAKPDKLKVIMTLHLVDAARPSSDLRLPDKKGVTGKRWPTAQGRHLTLTEKGGRIFINDDIKVTKADVPADNGLIYIIDTVITP
ncbi:MAG: fasciclin domain-containing protein [Myxococcota bacterium]